MENSETSWVSSLESVPNTSEANHTRRAPEANHSPQSPEAKYPSSLRRPTQDGEWWSVSEAAWDIWNATKKQKWSCIGRIMETDDGERQSVPCAFCADAGVECWAFTEETIRRSINRQGGKLSKTCARCRLKGSQQCGLPSAALTQWSARPRSTSGSSSRHESIGSIGTDESSAYGRSLALFEEENRRLREEIQTLRAEIQELKNHQSG